METEEDYPPFFYTAKASRGERNMGCDGLEETSAPKYGSEKRITVGGSKDVALPRANNHPTVKPIKLMEYLIKLVTPKGGIVLEPFAGSGTTLVAAKKLGYNFIGIEKEAEYIKIIEARLSSIKEHQQVLLSQNEDDKPKSI